MYVRFEVCFENLLVLDFFQVWEFLSGSRLILNILDMIDMSLQNV